MDQPAGELAARAIAQLGSLPLVGFAIQAEAPLARVVGFASFGRSLSNVVVSANKLQILRFAKDDNTPALVGLPIPQNPDGHPCRRHNATFCVWRG